MSLAQTLIATQPSAKDIVLLTLQLNDVYMGCPAAAVAEAIDTTIDLHRDSGQEWCIESALHTAINVLEDLDNSELAAHVAQRYRG